MDEYVMLRKAGEMAQIPVALYLSGSHVFQYPGENIFQSWFDQDVTAFTRLKETLEQGRGTPILFMEDACYYYSAFLTEERLAILGPVCTEKKDPAALRAFRLKHQLDVPAYIPKSSPFRLSAFASLLYYQMTGTDVDPDNIRIANALPEKDEWNVNERLAHYALEQAELDRDHDSAAYEAYLLRITEQGDVDAMEKLLQSSHVLEPEHIGRMSANDRKQMEYMIVSLIVLLSRAAVRGGAEREKTYSLSDVFMQKLASCKSTEEMVALGGRIQLAFTLEVQKAKKKSGAAVQLDYIKKCKTYIAANLRKPFKIGDIAPAIGVNRSYLASRFSQTEGMTLQQYVVRERCEHAGQLLIHSDYSIAMIAEYFCFSSQSHFGRAFKAYSGMTPREYREQYKRI